MITSGDFLVGAREGAQVFDRRQMTLEMTNTNEDNFIKGMVTFRISERLTVAVYRPKAFIYGTFANALALGSA
jgi:HK97 family phage major capsid protein